MGSQVLRRIGRLFITSGTLVLLFVGYQLFGTNVVAGRQQQAMAAELESTWELSTKQASVAAPRKGEPIGRIVIPKIAVDWVFVEGVDVDDLKKGPGHYPESPRPGRSGNAAIAGHRTTYGAPFSRLDELVQGDEIKVSDEQGTYICRVTEKKIVLPTELSVVDPTPDSRLTLTTCNPKVFGSATPNYFASLQA